MALPAKTADKDPLKDLVGRWEGLTAYGMGRYELVCDIRRKGRGFEASLRTFEHHFHDRQGFHAELRRSFWSRRKYSVKVVLEKLPDSPLKGEAWVGSPSPAGGDSGSLGREIVLAYRGSADRHRLRFSPEGGDRIRFSYAYLDPARGPTETSGELKRAERPAP